jgi:hypothetical protein
LLTEIGYLPDGSRIPHFNDVLFKDVGLPGQVGIFEQIKQDDQFFQPVEVLTVRMFNG